MNTFVTNRQGRKFLLMEGLGFPLEDAFTTADQHFGHGRIAELCGRPADHEALMEAAWNEAVPEGGTVLHLGDLACEGRGGLSGRLSRLHGRVRLVRGNHDNHGRAFYLGEGVEWFSKHPLLLPDAFSVPLVLSHRPLPAEELAEFDAPVGRLGGFLNLHGHSHGGPNPVRDHRHVDVGVDAAGYAPLRLLDLLREHGLL